jgi:hypothetical protein
MTTLVFNAYTVALAAVAFIFLASILLPADTWDRAKDWLAYRASYTSPAARTLLASDLSAPVLNRTMPWEKDARDARMAAAAIMQGEMAVAEGYGDDFAARWAEGKTVSQTGVRKLLRNAWDEGQRIDEPATRARDDIVAKHSELLAAHGFVPCATPPKDSRTV